MSHQGQAADEARAAEWAEATLEAFELCKRASGLAASGPMRRWQLWHHAAERLGADHGDWLNGGDGKMPKAEAARDLEVWRGQQDAAPEPSRAELARLALTVAAEPEPVAALAVVDPAFPVDLDAEAYETGGRWAERMAEDVAELVELETLHEAYRALAEQTASVERYAGQSAEWSRYIGVRDALAELVDKATGRA